MAAPLVQRVLLDKSEADRQLAALERQLAVLNRPIDIPVDIETDTALDQLQRDIARADNQTIDVDVDVDGISRAEREMAELGQEVEEASDQFSVLRRRADDSADAVLRVGTRGVSAFTNLRGSLIGVAAGLAAFQGFRVLGTGVSAAIQSASDLEESLSKTNIVFEEFSGDIQTFASTAPAALGLTTAAALESTSTFGNLFVALGLSQNAAADLAPEIVQLGSDLASFNNIQVAEAVEKLRAGLVGEVEPLRTLGVNLNATLVEAKALELGLVDSAGAVTEAGKVQARYALILEQTSTAQGDYARTSDGIANTQRTLQAEFGNLSVEIGQALLPAYQGLLELAPTLIENLGRLTPVITSISTAAADSVPSVQAFGDGLQALGEVPAAFGDLASILGGLGNVIVGPLQFLTDFEAGAARTNAGLEALSGTIEAISLSQVRNALVDSLQAGIEPALALDRALFGLTQLDLNTQELADASAAFAAISGVDASGLAGLSLNLLKAGDAAGLSADEIQAMRVALQGLFTDDFQRRTPGGGGGADIARRNQEIADAMLSEAEALEILEIAAAEADTTIFSLISSQQDLGPAVAAAVGTLSASTRTYLEQVDAINELDVATGALPGSIEAAADAMRDAEGEIVGDFETFLDNLRTTVAEQQEFDLGLALLRALGFDDLAAQFETAGTEAIDLVTQALADPAGAAEAERLIDGQYVGVGAGIKDDLIEGLEGEEINTALVQNLIDAAAEADTPEVRAALLALAEELRLEIPVSFGEVPAFLESPRVPDRSIPGVGGGGSDRSDLQGVAVVQNFYTEPQPTTQTQRAAQEINAVVGYAQGRAV